MLENYLSTLGDCTAASECNQQGRDAKLWVGGFEMKYAATRWDMRFLKDHCLRSDAPAVQLKNVQPDLR